MNIEWYTAYHIESGEIMATMMADSDSLEQNVQTGQSAIIGEYSNGIGYISYGAFSEYSSAVKSAKAQRPTYQAVWSNTSMAWVDYRGIHQVKADAWARIKAERDRRMAGTFTAAGKTYNCNREAINTAATGAMLAKAALYLTWTKTWTLADETSVTLTADQVLTVARVCDDYISDLWATGRTLRTQIAAATTRSDIEAITWP